ncbi:MAG: response regulator transcription factor [Coraliomargarita sp.]
MTKPNEKSDCMIENSADIPVILLVEDEAEYRQLIAADLQEGYHVVEAVNGKEGLEKALEIMPDLVLTDLMMPVMGGVELCRHLKGEVKTAHIPVLILTGETAVVSEVGGLEAGVDAYVTKPFNRQLLRARISNLLETRRCLSQHFSRVLDSTSEDYVAEMPRVPELHSRVDRDFWDRLCEILRDNHADPEFNIDSLASDLNMSQRSAQRKIKALVDLTPVQLIAEYRLNKVEALLRDTRVNVTELAFKVGFGDLSHFYRIFKRKYGMSPSLYRDVNT